MSAEIRVRLPVTYLMELSRGDPETGNLLHAIKHLSDFLARDLGKRWHEHRYAMVAFKAGVELCWRDISPRVMKPCVPIRRSANLLTHPMSLAAHMRGASELRTTKRKMSKGSPATLN